MESRDYRHCQAALRRERTPAPFEWKACWTPETVWTFWRREKSHLVGFEPRRVQYVAWSLNRLYMGILQNKPFGVLRVKMDALQVE